MLVGFAAAPALEQILAALAALKRGMDEKLVLIATKVDESVTVAEWT